MVYAIQRGADGLITIRSGANIPTRLRFLRREFASDYRLLAAVPGGKPEREDIEEQLHLFGAGKSGWYKPAPEVLRLIDEFRGGRFPEHVVVNGRGYALLRVSSSGETTPCPFCGKRHIHGPGSEGHKSGHCADDSFAEVVGDGVVLRRKNGYVLVREESSRSD